MVSRRHASIADRHRAVLCVRDSGGGSNSNGRSWWRPVPVYSASREPPAQSKPAARACRTAAMCRSDHAVVRATCSEQGKVAQRSRGAEVAALASRPISSLAPQLERVASRALSGLPAAPVPFSGAHSPRLGGAPAGPLATARVLVGDCNRDGERERWRRRGRGGATGLAESILCLCAKTVALAVKRDYALWPR